jgi:ATP-dependent DNA helicase RecQ
VKVEMRRAVERKRVKAGRKRAAVAPVTETLPDQARLARLKAWRLEEARRQDVPAYVILHDATLAEIARRCPTGPDELADITGIGKVKLERYGQVLVTLANGEVPATPEE